MIKELKELIWDICSINTNIDIEDVMEVAKINPAVESQLIELKRILQKINLRKEGTTCWTPPTPQPVQKPEEPSVAPSSEGTDRLQLNRVEDKSDVIVEYGITKERLESYLISYNDRNRKKMSFDTFIKSCIFVKGYIINNGTRNSEGFYRIPRVSVNNELLSYLANIDPLTDYSTSNVADFLRGKTLNVISKDFFKQSEDHSASVLIAQR